MTSHSNVGERRTYEGGDQKHYSVAANRAVGALNEVNTAAYMNKDEIVNELLYKEDQHRVNERMKHESGYAAMMHGHEPSKGAKIDAELARDDADMIKQKEKKNRGHRKYSTDMGVAGTQSE